MGDHVTAVVLGMDDDFSRISLSTAELEETDGDMKRNKVHLQSKRVHLVIWHPRTAYVRKQKFGKEDWRAIVLCVLPSRSKCLRRPRSSTRYS